MASEKAVRSRVEQVERLDLAYGDHQPEITDAFQGRPVVLLDNVRIDRRIVCLDNQIERRLIPIAAMHRQYDYVLPLISWVEAGDHRSDINRSIAFLASSGYLEYQRLRGHQANAPMRKEMKEVPE